MTTPTTNTAPETPAQPHRRRRGPARVGIVGIHGYGTWHLGEVRRLAERGAVTLGGVCDPHPPIGTVAELVGEAPWTDDLAELLAGELDVVIVATPIHTHVDIALQAAAAGSHLLLEKPPAPSLAEFDRLADGVRAAGVACQVGFQHLGSSAVDGIAAMIADGTLGDLRGVGAAGITVRDGAYFGRARWAGRRRLDGVDVVDGVLTNPFLHELAAALRLAGADSPDEIAGIELELHRANAIESDDTSVARIITSSGLTIVGAATLCAAEEIEAVVTVHGTHGAAAWRYRTENVDVAFGGETRSLTFERQSLLANLVAHLDDPAVPLIVPLASTRAVTMVVDAVRRAPDPRPIASAHVAEINDRPATRRVVAGVEASVQRAAAELSMFSEQPAAWLGDGPVPATTVSLAVGEQAVADYQLDRALDTTSSPRPFLHPVRTLGGTVVTDAEPDDHRWHLGVGMAIQEVAADGRNRVNFWGGRTYVRNRGYGWLDDHGTIRHLDWTDRSDGQVEHDLAWMAPDHHGLLLEQRVVAAERAADGIAGWVLTLRSRLRNISGTTVHLGSPGSNGRVGGGYGGFFWRLPPIDAAEGAARVVTDRGEGEDAVHGSVAPWLAWEVTAPADDGASFTLVAVADDEATAADPWFVRLAGYPGFGSALAWDRHLELAAGVTTTRGVRTLIVDGTGHDLAALAATLRAGLRPAMTGGADSDDR